MLAGRTAFSPACLMFFMKKKNLINPPKSFTTAAILACVLVSSLLYAAACIHLSSANVLMPRVTVKSLIHVSYVNVELVPHGFNSTAAFDI